MPRYGIAIHNNTFGIYTGGEYDERIGQCTKNDQGFTWNLPWFTGEFDGHWILDQNKNYVFMKKYMYPGKGKEIYGYVEKHPYQYVLKNGEIQNRTAIVYQEKRQGHRKWFPFVKMTNETINVNFNGEVGERTGSCKGGTIGCGYNIKKGETMYQTLKRMEKERKFN